MVKSFWDYSRTYVLSRVFSKYKTHRRFNKKKKFRMRNKPDPKKEFDPKPIVTKRLEDDLSNQYRRFVKEM